MDKAFLSALAASDLPPTALKLAIQAWVEIQDGPLTRLPDMGYAQPVQSRAKKALERAGFVRKTPSGFELACPSQYVYIHNTSTSDVSVSVSKQQGHNFALPDWIDPDLWEEFELMRKKLRKPMTDYARTLIVRDLEKFTALGHDPAQILQESIKKGWQGVFPLKAENARGERSRTINDMVAGLEDL